MSIYVDYKPGNNCKNPDSYGMICVKCNQCRRFDSEETPIGKQIREAWERLRDTSDNDSNYLAMVRELTNEELYYCYNMERRKDGFAILLAEARRRGIEV